MNMGMEMKGFTLLYVRAVNYLIKMTAYSQVNQADIIGGF